MPDDETHAPSADDAPHSYNSAPSADQYELERRKKRDELRQLGHNPYGGRVENVRSLADVRDLHITDFGQDGGPVVTTTGRIVLKRDMGKLSFLTLRDDTGELQIALQKNRLDEAGWVVRNHLDLGDLVVVTGPLGKTNKGEITVWATQVSMAAKSLVTPPDKHKGLEDQEIRYRQRYVDLWANPEVMETMKLRMRIIESARRYLRDRGYLEVETPMLQTMHGGAAARPFETHHRALDLTLSLRIAPELYLKRLLVGGFRKVFEINRNFRNEGISPRHNPEFTMLEAYEAYGNYETMAEMVEDMICTVAMEVFGTLEITHHGGHGEHGGEVGGVHHRDTETQRGEDSEQAPSRVINLQRPWRRVKMADLVEERTGWKFDKQGMSREWALLFSERILLRGEAQDFAEADFANIGVPPVDLDQAFRGIGDAEVLTDEEDLAARTIEDVKRREEIKRGATCLQQLSAAEQLVEVYEKLVEPTLIDPCFVTHVPSVIIPLARPSEEDPYFAEVYELAINGQEISPGYTELNDPDVQEQLFRAQVGEEAERQHIDYDFLNALKVGMPPAGGMGLGVDRLVMMLTGAESIRDVLLFPLMRPQANVARASSP